MAYKGLITFYRNDAFLVGNRKIKIKYEEILIRNDTRHPLPVYPIPCALHLWY